MVGHPTAYTIARWRVTRGQEAAFRAAWHELADVFSRLGRPPLNGTLLQHETESTLFVSFGPWSCPEDIHAMKRDPAAQDAFLRVTALCEETDWGAFGVVERVDLQPALTTSIEVDCKDTQRMRRSLLRAVRQPEA
jgi:hypothetical protein